MNMRAAQSGRCVKQFLLDGTLSATYESQSEAERKTFYTGVNITEIYRRDGRLKLVIPIKETQDEELEDARDR